MPEFSRQTMGSVMRAEGSIWIINRIEVWDNQAKTLFMQLDASFVSMTEPIVWCGKVFLLQLHTVALNLSFTDPFLRYSKNGS